MRASADLDRRWREIAKPGGSRHYTVMSESRPLRLAVLIDADNASSRIAPGLFEEIAKIGEANVRRIYGDFSRTQLKSWAEILSNYAIKPYQNFVYTKGKNASDIALVIDAMDLLHSGRFDGFCIVSSDSDFTSLAARIREQGLDVYGFGEQKTPESFRRACRRFIYSENLLPDAASTSNHGQRSGTGTSSIKPPNAATGLIRKAIDQLNDEDSWVPLSGVGKQLAILASDFDSRSYGESKLIDLVKKTGAFEVRRSERGDVQIRMTPAVGKRASVRTPTK